MHNGNGFTCVKPTLLVLVHGQIHLLVPDGVALCSYDFLNNPVSDIYFYDDHYCDHL